MLGFNIVALITKTAEALDWIKKYFIAELPVESSFTRKERMAENERVFSSKRPQRRIQEEATKHSREEATNSRLNANNIIVTTHSLGFDWPCWHPPWHVFIP